VQTGEPAWVISAINLRDLALQHPTLLNVISHHLWPLIAHATTLTACAHTLDIRARLTDCTSWTCRP
jgi:hypothetical protein